VLRYYKLSQHSNFEGSKLTSICTELTLGKEENGRAMEAEIEKATPMIINLGMFKSIPTAQSFTKYMQNYNTISQSLKLIVACLDTLCHHGN
jgi:hypothetical protein